VDDSGFQSYETDQNYTQTVNKKNVFKINLSFQENMKGLSNENIVENDEKAF
jgi:hypothetical protein